MKDFFTNFKIKKNKNRSAIAMLMFKVRDKLLDKYEGPSMGYI